MTPPIAESTSLLVPLTAFIGLAVNTLAFMAVVWKGGRVLGHIDGTLVRFADQLASLKDHPQILARVVAQLDDLERRVERLETYEDRRDSRGSR